MKKVTTNKQGKKKVVKAWAVLRNGWIIGPGWGAATLWVTKSMWEAVNEIVEENLNDYFPTKVVPCTISYTLPAPKKRV